MGKISFHVFCIFILFFQIKATAQIKISAEVQEAIKAAENRSFELKEQDHEIAKTMIGANKVKHKYIPSLSITGGIAHFRNEAILDLTPISLPILPSPIFNGTQDLSAKGNIMGAGLMAKSVLFSGLQIPKANKALHTKAEAEKLLRDAKAESIAKEILTALDNLSVLQYVDSLLLESKKRLEVEKKRVDKAIENGLAIPFDRDKIVLASLELEAKSKEAEGSRNILLEQLTYLTGFSRDRLMNLTHYFESIPLLEVNGLQLNNKKELEALELFIEAQEHNVSREQNSILPQIAAFAGLQYAQLFNSEVTLKSLPLTGNNLSGKLDKLEIAPNWMIGVGLKWEIFEGLQRKHRIDEAKLDRDLLIEKRKDSEEKLNLLLTKQKSDWQTQSDLVSISQQKLRISRQNLDRAIQQYKQGLLSINDRLGSENDYFTAALDVAKEIAKQRKLSIDLLLTSGNFSESIDITP